MNIDRQKPVLVTGANGYIASWLVKKLLEEGLTVHGTVRDPNNTGKVGHLHKIADKSSGTLKLFAADLLKEGAFDEAIQGCELVFHTASPFVVRGIKDPMAELVEPAKLGTRNVLEAANRCDSVKRIVLTSSVVGIYGDAVDILETSSGVFTEEYWNTTSRVDHQPYNYSKVEAEKVGWDIQKAQDRWDLVVVNPGLVMGPSLTTASNSTSLSTIKELVDGSMRTGVPDLNFALVDVRDVALAHYQAGFTPSASGRHILTSTSTSLMGMVDIIKQQFGKKRFAYPMMIAPKWIVSLMGPSQGVTREFVKKNVGYPLEFDNSYTRKDLDMVFRPIEETISDHLQQMLDDGIVK
ncbi:dihydrokaempferol 4-reductase [gamma proteobacterium HTCC5015]|nr:dihydrokaempferol 4-reductase [gamma proteobacterium HTCC5015]